MSNYKKVEKKINKPSLLEISSQLTYKNRLVVKHYSNLTIRKALAAPSPSIGRISKTNEEVAVRCIVNLFKAVSMYFNDEPMTNAKLEVLADEILSKYEFRNLKLEDLVVIGTRIKESNIFKLTIAKILSEVKKYSKEREQLAIDKSMQNSSSHKNTVNYTIEDRISKHYNTLPDAQKLISNRNLIIKKFK